MEGGKSSKSFWERVLLINPYYFALLLIGMMSLNVYHVLTLDQAWTLSPIYFLSYALMESVLEVLVFVFIGNLIKTYLPKGCYYGFISFCFLFFALHYVDFILTRFMDISVFYGFYWVFDESLENFIELLHLTGISIQLWLLILGAVLVVIPLTAVLLYRLTGKFAQKPLKITHKGLVKTLCCLPLGLLALDLTMTPRMNRQDYHYYQRILPWKSTLISQEEPIIHLTKPLKALSGEKEILRRVHSVPLAVEHKPNIYLFVVESLREDIMTADVARHIDAFRKENVRFGKTYSNANCTQEAWYSIFSGKYPFHWAEAKKNHSGSIPLQILKKMGYDIHVYSAAQLKYYGMDPVMFGKKHYLADSYHVFPHYFPVEAWESDQKAIETFLVDSNKKWAKEGNVFIFFIESTHFNYSWPKDYQAPFTPYSSERTHLRVSNSINNIELIKNRYRNSIHYMDCLFGKVIDHLKEQNLYDDAVILFTADHGEEFFEEGQLFHASHLSQMQTEPPIYMKLGSNQRAKELNLKEMRISQVDLFPTVIDYLLGNQPYDVFDGESIFKEERNPYIISARFNGPRAPREFFIHDGDQKCIFRFQGRQDLELRVVKGANGEVLEPSKEEIQERFSPIFKSLFN
ncbi:MAG: sulfatase-like hydrolase/transferase [Chlamydiia bacterium]|nr:sulfatase-like hydrolase/transferase [Chlamydiia bacterium]